MRCFPAFTQETEQVSDSAINVSSIQEEGTVAKEDEIPPAALLPVTLPLARKQRSIGDDQWRRLSADPAFQYEELNPQTEPEPSPPGFWARIIIAIAEFFTSGTGTIILWVILVLVVLFIIFRVLKMKGNLFFAKKDRKINTGANEYADEYVPDDWLKSIQDAADNGNYRLAVRHAYRYLLVLLEESGQIKFQVAKTNYQYAYELAGTQWHQPFLQMTRQYEYAWYGGFELKQQQFERYYNLLKDIKSRLG